MTTGDVPGFLQNMGDTPAEQEIMSSLKDDIITDDTITPPADTTVTPPADTTTPPADPTPAPPADTTTPPETPPANPDDKPKEGEDVLDAFGEPIKKKEDTTTTPAPTTPPATPPVTPPAPITPPAEPQKPTTPDPALSIQRAAENIANLNKGAIKPEDVTEFHKAVQLASKTPLIFPENLPKKEDFVLEDGAFDIDGYSKQLIGSVIMAVQKSITGGPLAAATYGILMEAMKEESGAVSKEAELDKYAKDIMGKLETAVPRLKDDKELQELFDDTLNGVMVKRSKLIATGQKLPDMVYEDYEKILTKLIGNGAKPATPPTPPDPVENLNGGITMNDTTTPSGSEEDSDIDAMLRVKKKSLF